MLVESIALSVLLLLSVAVTPLVRPRLPLSVDNVIRVVMPAPLLCLAAATLSTGYHYVAAIALGYSGLQLVIIACWFVPTNRSRWSSFERQFWAYVSQADGVRG